MIGIVSHDGDIHASAIRAELSRLGGEYRMLDTAHIPVDATLTLEYGSHVDPYSGRGWAARWHEASTGAPVEPGDLSELRAMWWRRPQPYQVSPGIGSTQDRFFAAGECDAAVTGMWACLDATWVNSPDLDVIAGRKPYQLKLATEDRWRIPRTCITNDPTTAREFAAAERRRGCRVIYKPFSGTPQTWRETRLLSGDGEAQLDLVRLAPVIFQEAIPGGVDIRVTIVGERIFAAEIRPSGTAAEFDFRIEPEAPIVEHRLPDEVMERLRTLMRRLGLFYGAVDLRLAPNGEYVFLEVNPAGQWLFVEVATGQTISTALAELLMSMEHAHTISRSRSRSGAQRTVLA